MTPSGYLILLDITGYTAFLAGTEPEHAHGILRSLLGTLAEHIAPPLVIAELEGDAIFAWAPAGSFLEGQTLVEVIESLYCVFAAAREQMERTAACDCNGCRLFPDLDLKVIVHHGSFTLSEIIPGMGSKPIGTAVVLAHRLLKNRITETTGVKSYAFFSHAAIDALRLDWLAAAARTHAETYEHLGVVEGRVHDLAPAWLEDRERRRLTMSRDESWFEVETEIDVPVAVVWDHLNSPACRKILLSVDRLAASPSARTGPGTENNCFKGERVLIERIVEWHPFRRMTLDCPWFPDGTVRVAIELEPAEARTRVVARVGKPQWRRSLPRPLLLALTGLRFATTRERARRNLAMLRARMETDVAHSGGRAPMS